MLIQRPRPCVTTAVDSSIKSPISPIAGLPVGSPTWIHGAVADVILGWCWLPVALAVHSVGSSVSRTQELMAIVFVVSFAHQPLTLGLVYGDSAQRSRHRLLFRWAPLVVVAVIVIGLNISLALVGLIAGLWNAEHTLMQRYGVIRIYGRKAGDDHGRIEKPMLVAWLVTALLFLGAFVDLPAMAAKIGVDRTNARGMEALDSIGEATAVLFWLGALVSMTMAWRWIRAESRSLPSAARNAKWIYVAGTLGLVIAVMVDPIAGIAGYVAAHAIEYFGIVHSSLRRRAAIGDVSHLALAAATRSRRIALYAIYFVLTGLLIGSTYRLWDGRVYAFAILLFGALHILYDGFVWKLRRPSVAAGLGIATELVPGRR